jgi:hypothetical protein
LHIVLPTKETTFFMKKITYIFALLALTACSNDDVIGTTSSDEIHLSVTTETPKLTASRVSHEGTLLNDFTLFALNSDDSKTKYLENERVVYSDGIYSFAAGTRYWPDYALNFYAVHCLNGDETIADNKTQTVYSVSDVPKFLEIGVEGKYSGIIVNNVILPSSNPSSNTVADDSSQDDILYARVENVTNATSNTVTLNFRHALAKIQFTVKAATDQMYVEIPTGGVELCGFTNKGDLWIGAPFGNETSTNFSEGTNDDYTYSNDCSWDPSSDADHINQSIKCKAYAKAQNCGDRIGIFHDYYTDGADQDNTIQAQDGFYVMPYKYDAGQYKKTDGKWTGVYFKIKCLVCHIEDADLLDRYTEAEDISYTNLCKGQASADLLNGGTITEREGREDVKVALDPCAVVVWGNDTRVDGKYATTTDDDGNTVLTDAIYKELYIPIPEILRSNPLLEAQKVGWEAGKCYRYDISFDTTGTSTAYDKDGQPVKVNIDFTVTNDDWSHDVSSSEVDN